MTRKKHTGSVTGDEPEAGPWPRNADGSIRCHFTPEGWFIPGCMSAALGEPDHCSCDSLQKELERVQRELGAMRRQLAAEQAKVARQRTDPQRLARAEIEARMWRRRAERLQAAVDQSSDSPIAEPIARLRMARARAGRRVAATVDVGLLDLAAVLDLFPGAPPAFEPPLEFAPSIDEDAP